LEDLAPQLKGGRKMLNRSVDCGVGESTVAGALGEIQERYPAIKIGSYPQMGRLPVYTQLVLRGTDETLLDAAAKEVKTLVDKLHAEKGIVLPEETETNQ